MSSPLHSGLSVIVCVRPAVPEPVVDWHRDIHHSHLQVRCSGLLVAVVIKLSRESVVKSAFNAEDTIHSRTRDRDVSNSIAFGGTSDTVDSEAGAWKKSRVLTVLGDSFSFRFT